MAESVENRELRVMLEGWARTSTYEEDLEAVALLACGAADEGMRAIADRALARDANLAEALEIVVRAPATPRWRTVLGVALAAAAAILIAVLDLTPAVGPDASDLVPKGSGDDLAIAVEREGRRFELAAGDALRTGDAFGLFYSATTNGYLTVVHRSGDTTRLVHPQGPVEHANGVALPEGGRVQDVAGCEWLVGVFSNVPLEEAHVVADVESASKVANGCRLPVQVSGARAVVVVPIEP